MDEANLAQIEERKNANVRRASPLKILGHLLTVAPFFLSGGILVTYAVLMVWVSLDRTLGLAYFSPLLLIGGFLLCAGSAVATVLRKSDAGR